MSNVIQLKERNSSAREEVAASVRGFIARAGITKSAVAQGIGMAQSTFSRRTTGSEPFDADELGALADYFGVTLVDLVAGNVGTIPPNAKKAPTRKSRGPKLPKLDSNQQPVGSQPGDLLILPTRTTQTQNNGYNAVITPLFANA